MAKQKTKVVKVPVKFLGFGQARARQKLIDKWTKKGFRLVESTGWGGRELVFVKEETS